MKWPWQRDANRVTRHDVPPATSLDEARAARRQSETGLAHARQRDPAVRRVAESLRGHRRDNHFAGMLETIFKEKHG